MSQNDYLRLGHVVEPLRLETVRGSAMPATTLTTADGSAWGVTSAQLIFDNGVTWTGTVAGAVITWTATQAQVDAQPNGSRVTLRLDTLVCAVGEVVQRG